MISRPIALSSAKKILVAGAFATGKTTLAKRLLTVLAQEGIAGALVSDVARRSPFALNRDQTPIATAWMIGEQIRSESKAMVGRRPLVVCDRGMPDFISHTIVLDMATAGDRILTESLIELARAWGRSYDAVFWAKMDPGRAIDPAGGLRIVDKVYQGQLERAIENSFALLKMNPIVLPQETDERVRVVAAHVLQALKPRGAPDKTS